MNLKPLLFLLIISSNIINSFAVINNSTTNAQNLHFKLKPNNAFIFIDSTFVQKGECTIQLKPGTYKYQIKAPKYHDQSGVVTITDKKYELNIALLPSYGSISVTLQNLVGGTILLDDKELIQTTPCLIENIKSGEHTIQIIKESFLPFSKNIEVEDGKITTVNCNLNLSITNFVVNSENSESINLVGQNKNKNSKAYNLIDMVLIKGGSFEMGTDFEEYEFEAQMPAKPKHNVKVSDFYIAKTELTQAQWFSVMGTNPSVYKGDELPVDNISWIEVQDYIKKLNQLTGKNYRLPTEAEWEYAAGGGEGRGTLFSGTDNPLMVEKYAWTLINSDKLPHAVATLKPNKLGLYDMSGNVWEWCNDWLWQYSNKDEINPTGPSTGIRRVHRGGSWHSSISLSSIKRRGGFDQNSRNCRIGFRLAMNYAK